MAINSTERRVLINKGVYDNTLQYYPMDAVYYEESYYICIKACVGIDPTDTNYWGYSHSLGDIGISLGIRLSDGILYITDTITTKDLGKVSILYRGEYSSTATYASLDVVTYDGSSYICIKDTTGNLPTDPTYFGLLCDGTEGRGITSVTLSENKHLLVAYTDGTSTDLGEIVIKTPLDQIDAVSINSDGHLILSKDDGTALDAGYAVGPRGDTGVGLESARVNEDGDLILTYTTGVSKNVGTVGFGASIVDSNVSADGHLQFTMSNGATIDAGYVKGPAGPTGPRGEKGDPFRYEDFTVDQLEGLRGPQGEKGIQGERGPAFTYSDFTESQLEALRGPKGEDAPQEAVLFVTQTLTTEQQTQSRTNIGAASEEETNRLSSKQDNQENRLTSVENDTAALKNFTPHPFEVSGDIVQVDMFQDAPLNVVTHIEPIQSGSGDPYPAGGGKNLLNLTIPSPDAVIVQNTDGTITVTNNTGGVIVGARCELTGILPSGTYTISKNDTSADVFLQQNSEEDYSNNITTYTFNYDGVSYLRVLCSNIQNGSSVTYKIQLEKGSTATEYAPYANIRPISGRTVATLTRCGKNLIPSIPGSFSHCGVSFTLNKDGSITAIGTKTDYSGQTCASVSAVAFRGKTLTITAPDPVYIRVGLKVINTDDKIVWIDAEVTREGYYTFVMPDNAVTMAFNFFVNTESELNYTFYPQLGLGSTATAYEPYTGDTYTADFGQTVYGGTLDWKTGVLTATHGQIAAYSGESLPGAWISDRDVYADGAMPTTGAQVVYKLATPTTIQLTPHQITALQGINNIWSNAGETTVSGRKDIIWLTHSLLERIAALEAAVAGI